MKLELLTKGKCYNLRYICRVPPTSCIQYRMRGKSECDEEEVSTGSPFAYSGQQVSPACAG